MTDRKKFQTDPLHDPILKGMLILGMPVALSALLTMLFSCADTVVIGRFGHPGAITAIGVSASVLNLLVGGLTALAAGVTVTAGNLYGQGRKDRVRELAQTLPLTALFLGALLSLFALSASRPILLALNCPPQALADALVYFRIYFCGVPFTMVSTFLSALLQARGDSFTPFCLQMAASLLNILLNLLFVIVFDWNVAGVALATVISQFLLAAAVLFLMTGQENELKLDLLSCTFFHRTGSLFSIGIPSSLEGMVLNLSGVIIASVINRFDSAVIAGNSIATTLEGLIVVTFAGFENASAVFISQNCGAGRLDRVRKTYRITVAAVFLCAEGAGILIWLASPALLGIFTGDEAIRQAASVRLFYMCLFFGLLGLMNVVSGCVRGLGDARTPLYISVLGSVFFRLGWIFTFAARAGTIESVYLSYPLCWSLCSALNMAAFARLMKKEEKRRKDT